MGFGFSKDFVIFLFIAVILSLGFENWRVGVSFMFMYVVCKVIWRILT
jgi:hypothetical protein